MRSFGVWLFVAAGAAAPWSAGCTSSTREHVETAAANVLLPPEEEQKLGQEVHADISRQVRFVDDDAVKGYVQDICNKLFTAAKRDQPDLAIDVYVIDDPKTVNAFATPGQQLYVYSGLLLAADTDAEVAGVLGHETGHIVARHPARQMVDAFGLDAVTSLLLGQNPSLAAQIAAQVGQKGFLLANSRADETVADEYGARYAHDAGYDASALAQFLTKISAGQPQPPRVLVWLSDHPTTPDRVSHLESYIKKNNLTGGESGGGRIKAIQSKLSNMPEPAAPPQSAPVSGGAQPGGGAVPRGKGP